MKKRIKERMKKGRKKRRREKRRRSGDKKRNQEEAMRWSVEREDITISSRTPVDGYSSAILHWDLP